jgi:RNA polymerase sigma factor (sigma-70 family)
MTTRDLHELLARGRATSVQCLALSYYGPGQPPTSPTLSPIEVRRLFMEYRRTGSPAAKDKLVRQHLCFALRMASKFRGPRLDIDEAVSAANAGLVEAIERFKPGRNTKFVVFAYMTIRRHLVEALMSTYPVKISRHLRKKLRVASAGNAPAGGEPRTLDELYEALGSAPDFDPDLLIEQRPDAPFMPHGADAPDAHLDSLLRCEEVRTAVARLPAIERAVIEARHFSEEVRSFEQISRELGQTKKKVRAAYAAALGRLRRALG